MTGEPVERKPSTSSGPLPPIHTITTRSARPYSGHDDLRYFLGVGDHDNVRSPVDFSHRRAHTVVAEAVGTGVNTPVGGRKHHPDRTAALCRSRRGLGERNTGKGGWEIA
jgi:hypothetical protein